MTMSYVIYCVVCIILFIVKKHIFRSFRCYNNINFIFILIICKHWKYIWKVNVVESIRYFYLNNWNREFKYSFIFNIVGFWGLQLSTNLEHIPDKMILVTSRYTYISALTKWLQNIFEFVRFRLLPITCITQAQ